MPLADKLISDDGVQPLLLFHCAASSQQFVSMWVSWGEWETGNIRNNLSFCWCSSLGCGASAWFTMIYITYICMTTPWHLRATLGESRGLAPAPCCSKALPNLRKTVAWCRASTCMGLRRLPLKAMQSPGWDESSWCTAFLQPPSQCEPIKDSGFQSTLQSTMSSILFNSSFINDSDTFDTEALRLHPQKLPHLVGQQIVVKLAVSYHDTMYHHVGLLNLHIHNTHWIHSHAQNATRKAKSWDYLLGLGAVLPWLWHC